MKAHARVLLISFLLPGASFAVTLDECLEAANENNPDLMSAVQRVNAAAAAVDSARAAWYPTLFSSLAYGLTDNPGQAFFMELNQRTASLNNDFNQPDDTENYRGSIGFRMLLLDGGQRGLMNKISRLGMDAHTAMLDAARNELHYQVSRAYYSVNQAAAFVDVRRETIASLEENLRVAREKYEAGSALKTDVLNLDVQLAEAKENLIRAENGVLLSVAALNTSIGADMVTRENMPALVNNNELTPPPASPEQDQVENRPEYAGAALKASAASLDAIRARRDRLPSLKAFGTMDWDSDELSGFEESYIVGAALEWDLFTGFQRRAAIADTKARELEAMANREALRNQLQLDLVQSHIQTREAWDRLHVVQQSIQSAEEALRITSERYQEGAADITELLTAQVGLTATRSRTTAAFYDYLIARANFDRATGLISSSLPNY